MYCTVAEVREVATQITATAAPTAWTDDVVTKVIERASRIFDLVCDVEPEHFEAAGASATSRTFYGDGTNFLRLDPYVEGSLSATITLPSGYTSPSFVEREGLLILVDSLGVRYPSTLSWYGTGWYENVPVTVSARWGFAATPADVKHAVIELVINLIKEVDPASIKMMNLDGIVLREKLPPRVEMIASKYRRRGAVLV
jgi:hypothetical protein